MDLFHSEMKMGPDKLMADLRPDFLLTDYAETFEMSVEHL